MDKFDTLQILLACDRTKGGRKTAARPAVSALVGVGVRKLKEVIAIAASNALMGPTDMQNVYGYDVETDAWHLKSYRASSDLISVSMNSMRFTVLHDGSVMICATTRNFFDMRAYMFYPDRQTNQFEHIDVLTARRYICREGGPLVTLHDGRVLRLGGLLDDQVYRRDPMIVRGSAVYNPSTQTWTELTLPRSIPYSSFCIVLLDGTVLVTGGIAEDNITILATCLIYDAHTNTFTNTGAMTIGRCFHTGCLLANGDVFIDRGVTNVNPDIPRLGRMQVSACERYSVASGTWRMLRHMLDYTFVESCALLPTGEVMINANESSVFNSTAYNPETNERRHLAAMPRQGDSVFSIPLYE